MNSRAGCPTYRISSADPSATWVHLHKNIIIDVKNRFHSILYLQFYQDENVIFYGKYMKTSVVVKSKLLYNEIMS